jgi:DNA-3-methyladenine glycosylase
MAYIRNPPFRPGLGRLSRGFYERDSPRVAVDLLGCRLVRVSRGKRTAGTIVEVEAYGGQDDPASHAFKGMTKRNSVMFGGAGRCYVYLSYGANYCMNVTTEKPGKAGAVLLRALEPTEGVELMLLRRRTGEPRLVASGPGRLTEAMAVGPGFNGEDLVKSERLFVEEREHEVGVAASTRVGISKGTDKRWRYFVAGSRFVSKGRPSVDSHKP